MKRNRSVLIGVAGFALILLPSQASTVASRLTNRWPESCQAIATAKKTMPVDAARLHNPVLWHDPGAISRFGSV